MIWIAQVGRKSRWTTSLSHLLTSGLHWDPFVTVLPQPGSESINVFYSYMNAVSHMTHNSCKTSVCISPMFSLYHFTRGLLWREVNWSKTRLKIDVWKSGWCLPCWRSVIIIVPGRVDSQAGHWVTFLLCTSFPQFVELIQSSQNHWEYCSYLLCVLGQVPQVSKGNHFWLVRFISLEHLCLFCTGRVVLLTHTAWSGKHLMVALCQEDFQKHLLLLPLPRSTCDLSCDKETAGCLLPSLTLHFFLPSSQLVLS